MLIYSAKKSPRLEYALRILFRQLLSLNYTLTDDYLFYQEHAGPKIHYGERRLADDGFFLSAHSLLFEEEIQPVNVEVIQIGERPALFPAQEDSDWPFDLFSMCFYCLSRYEEYLDFTGDRYGRFPASESVAYKYDFLQRPILNEWAYYFGKTLKEKWPKLDWEKPKYQFQLTFDIDMAWAYLHRPWWRLISGGVAQLLRGQWGGLRERVQVLRGRAADPFYVFDYLDHLQEQLKIDTLYFWLLGDPAKYDLNADVQLPAFRELIRRIARRYPIGIHPSFQSNTAPAQVDREIQRLKNITRGDVSRSRQHFLILSFPKTYQKLLSCGITDDYSMGYADQVGYRAGIAAPFLWYDLQREQITNLTIHPFAAMDVTLNFYLKMKPTEALEYLDNMAQAVRQYGGTFTLLWHNSSFASQIGWTGWRDIFEQILRIAK